MPTPRATYRLQIRPGFDFDAAAALADYLTALGVSHLYASPYLQAAPGSTHGYDVVDPSRVNAELGGEAGHARLGAALGEAGLGQVLDVVPNHMAITPENRWWWDVLRNGPASRYAPFFDVDWDPPEPKLRNRVLMPVLGDHYGREVEDGTVQVTYDDGRFRIRYHDHALPVAPRSLGALLQSAAGRPEARPGSGSAVDATAVGPSEAGGGEASAPAAELGFLGRSLERLPEPGFMDARARRRRQRDVAVIDHRVRHLLGRWPELRQAVEAELAAVNADPDRLDALLTAQNYRLAYWRTAGQEIDYRRFFDIDALAALRTEDEEVFAAVHGRVLEWLRTGVLDGIRVDHPDGLRRPGEYFRRIRAAAPDAWVVAEKILMPGEPLPRWEVDGTTGYDFLNDLTAVFVDPAGEAPLTALWQEWTGDDRSFHEFVHTSRHDVLRDVLAADVNRLANIFVDLCEARRRYRDFTRRELRAALVEVAACFPVYRTYLGQRGPESEREEDATAWDQGVIEGAVAGAREGVPELDPELLDFLQAILLGRVQDDEARGLRMRFQQLTGPVAAKGEEDTAFYRYNRLVALNEVGGDPGRWGLSPAELHARLEHRAAEMPATMNALSTHDTKRSEDVRARLLVLAEVPERWAEAVTEWRRRNREFWPESVPPDPSAEYLLYQTLVGAWPIDEDRVARYMEKATREAKLRTSWTDPDGEYDSALRRFIARLYETGFEAEVDAFVAPLVEPGRTVALAQKLVQLMAPGVPDVYQGTELWDLSLVDPDNRRPVDFPGRRRLLATLDGEPEPEDVLEEMETGLPKLWTVRQALRVRAERPASFGGAADGGGYTPLRPTGPAAPNLFGFLRGEDVAVLVPRLVVGLERAGGWGRTRVTLPVGSWQNVLTGEAVAGGERGVAELLGRFPVSLLVRRDDAIAKGDE